MKILIAGFEMSCIHESRILVSDMQKTDVVATYVYSSKRVSYTYGRRREYLCRITTDSVSCVAQTDHMQRLLQQSYYTRAELLSDSN